MGLDFIRAKGERFLQKRDASKATELLSPDLMSNAKPDTRTRQYRCILTDPEARLLAGVGAVARVISEARVVIIHHAREVGHVVPENVATVIEDMRRNQPQGGILSVVVVEAPDFNGEFIVRPKSPLQ